MCVCVCVCVWRGGLCVCARMWPQLRVLCMCRECVPVCVCICVTSLHAAASWRSRSASPFHSIYIHIYVNTERDTHTSLHAAASWGSRCSPAIFCPSLPIRSSPLTRHTPHRLPQRPPTPFSAGLSTSGGLACVCVCVLCVCLCVHAKTYANA